MTGEWFLVTPYSPARPCYGSVGKEEGMVSFLLVIYVLWTISLDALQCGNASSSYHHQMCTHARPITISTRVKPTRQ
jgi:hypothetical protein